uniref:Uncharacterized protein n=1 Tax=Marseillevirus LCMAC101 TaxID=2506602 RepID=A0A481YT11_9VIRU|nr:MAG: hypothetical protein LCMAC101_02210 [Marseillevirus LCMAC101]
MSDTKKLTSPSASPKYKKHSFKYVVIDTGYVSRLWETHDTIDENHRFFHALYINMLDKYDSIFDEGDFNFEDEKLYFCDREPTYVDSLMELKKKYEIREPGTVQYPKLLFAHDNIWGKDKGAKFIVKGNSEAKKMSELFEKEGLMTDGIMCFKCEDCNLMDLLNLVRENHYCATFDVTDFSLYSGDGEEEENPCFLIVTVDSESG